MLPDRVGRQLNRDHDLRRPVTIAHARIRKMTLTRKKYAPMEHWAGYNRPNVP
jgi:hypothetical protein